MDHEWISLRRAAEILGVHPATVRSWADKGDLPSHRTPGGHRRFLKSDLEQYVQANRDTMPSEVQVILQNALGQVRMDVGDGMVKDAPWYKAMSEKSRMVMRQRGGDILTHVSEYLAAGAPDAHLGLAVRLGKEHAVILIEDGLTLPQAMRGFFYFSDFVITAILAWSAAHAKMPPNAGECAALLRQINTFMHTMLLSIVEYYESE